MAQRVYLLPAQVAIANDTQRPEMIEVLATQVEAQPLDTIVVPKMQYVGMLRLMSDLLADRISLADELQRAKAGIKAAVDSFMGVEARARSAQATLADVQSELRREQREREHRWDEKPAPPRLATTLESFEARSKADIVYDPETRFIYKTRHSRWGKVGEILDEKWIQKENKQES